MTLAQLVAVFAPEVREIWQAEQEAAASANAAAEGEAMTEPFPAEAISDLPIEPIENAPVAAEPVEQETPPETDPEAAAKRAARNEDRAIREYLRTVLDALMAELETGDRGVEIREIAGGYRMATKPEYHDAIRSFVKSLKPPMKLSLQSLETLAVVAYKQPVTGPEISEIRGVETAGVLGSLLARKLITTAGRKQVIGRPILYKTTKEFLLRFGLKDVNDLPSMEEFEKMAGELAETEAEGEAQDAANLSAEAGISAEAAPPVEAEQQAEESAEETAPPSAEPTTTFEEAAADLQGEPQAEHQTEPRA